MSWKSQDIIIMRDSNAIWTLDLLFIFHLSRIVLRLQSTTYITCPDVSLLCLETGSFSHVIVHKNFLDITVMA